MHGGGDAHTLSLFYHAITRQLNVVYAVLCGIGSLVIIYSRCAENGERMRPCIAECRACVTPPS